MNKAGKKDCEVNLDKKQEDPRHLLCLAHYSMPLSAVFLPEGCLAHIIISESDNGPQKVDDLFKKGQQLVDIFSMEHFYEYDGDLQKFKDRMCFFSEANILKSSENET